MALRSAITPGEGTGLRVGSRPDGVVALDAESTVETVADGMAAHPTLSEAIKEAGLVALGRPIHIPIRKRAAARA